MSQNAGFTVSESGMVAGAVAIDIREGSHNWLPSTKTLRVILDSLDQAQALRDALSAFLAFHQPRSGLSPTERALKDHVDTLGQR